MDIQNKDLGKAIITVADGTVYNEKQNYERLVLVKYNGKVYLSKKDVGAGNPPTGSVDDEYWLDYEVKASSVIIGTAYIRAANKPDKPTGGSYNSPHPVEDNWKSEPYDGDNILYVSIRKFTEDGIKQDNSWSEPFAITYTKYYEIKFSTIVDNPGDPDSAPQNWSDAGSNFIWMAVREVVNDSPQAWVVTKFKGDKGDQGIQGIQGDKGDQGIQGDKGDKGDRGEQGIQGDKGDKGDRGEQGIQGIQGEPGKSFNVAGEYATLEALKSAVPDGSAVDGFMAVGTEAPYDYYAWVNGEWVSQGKIGEANVIVLPREILDLTGSSSSEEIFATFGGIDKYKDLLEKLSANNYLVQIGEPSLGSLRHIYTLVEYSVKFASNKQSGALYLNIYNEDRQLRRLHFYLENNGTTAHCQEASTFQLVKDSDVLTKTNTSSFTPTGDYQPATKKYVDDKHIVLTITDEAHTQLISNQEAKAEEAESKINLVFGSTDNFKNIIQRLLSDTILFLKITEKEIFKVSTSHTYCNPDNGSYELSFIYPYTAIIDANNINIITKRIFIALKANVTNFFVVKDILVSDITTPHQETAAEYEAISSKDDNTAYCVTD